MPSARLCRLLLLLPAYGGAVAAGLRRAASEAQDAAQSQGPVFRSGPPAAGFSRATAGSGGEP